MKKPERPKNRRMAVSLGGIWKGITVTEADIREARNSFCLNLKRDGRPIQMRELQILRHMNDKVHYVVKANQPLKYCLVEDYLVA